MVFTQSPIAKLIYYTYQEPTVFGDFAFNENLENLIDLIKFRTQTKGIEYTSQSLQNELFDIRIELLEFLLEKPEILKGFEGRIIQEIANKFYLSGGHKKLGQLVADSLDVYIKIYSHLTAMISVGLINMKPPSKSDMPSLNGLKNLLSLQPNKDLENFIIWLESSISFDYALLVSEFIFNGELKLKANEITQLESFLKKTIIDFGTYSIIAGVWTPDVDDELQLIRNIKIKAATKEIESGKVLSYSNEALQELILN